MCSSSCLVPPLVPTTRDRACLCMSIKEMHTLMPCAKAARHRMCCASPRSRTAHCKGILPFVKETDVTLLWFCLLGRPHASHPASIGKQASLVVAIVLSTSLSFCLRVAVCLAVIEWWVLNTSLCCCAMQQNERTQRKSKHSKKPIVCEVCGRAHPPFMLTLWIVWIIWNFYGILLLCFDQLRTSLCRSLEKSGGTRRDVEHADFFYIKTQST